MKILYAIQGTGNGHISRARDIIPVLQRKAELDILVSGTEAEVSLPYPVKYYFKGLSFVFGKKGGIDLLSTYKKANLKRLYEEVKGLDVQQYDLIINDFEPVSAWACKFSGKECISLSHQSAVLHKSAPVPANYDLVGAAVLKNYAPSTEQYGFHFEAYDSHIFTPVIRSEIRNAKTEQNNHYTVYLPAYSDKRILKVLGRISYINWQVFTKHSTEAFTANNISFQPIENEAFIKSMATCRGILCGAGFETPAEAMFLNKKLLVIPMKGQYEQQCNAAALAAMGVSVIKSLKLKHLDKIESWIHDTRTISIQYPDHTEEIIDLIIDSHVRPNQHQSHIQLGEFGYSLKKFRKLSLAKIIQQISH